MLHFIVWLIVSGIAGLIASKVVNKSGSGMILDVVLGIVGGFVGGFIVTRLPFLSGLDDGGGVRGLLVEIIVAAVGAMLVIVLYNLIFRRN